jgi:hypothetical protein
MAENLGGYVFSTQNTLYTVENTQDPNIQLFSGGNFNKNAIYRPQGLIGEGRPFVATFAPTQANVNQGIANATVQTSPITSVHAVTALSRSDVQSQVQSQREVPDFYQDNKSPSGDDGWNFGN